MINPKVEALRKLSKEMGKLLTDRVKDYKSASIEIEVEDEEEDKEED